MEYDLDEYYFEHQANPSYSTDFNSPLLFNYFFLLRVLFEQKKIQIND